LVSLLTLLSYCSFIACVAFITHYTDITGVTLHTWIAELAAETVLAVEARIALLSCISRLSRLSFLTMVASVAGQTFRAFGSFVSLGPLGSVAARIAFLARRTPGSAEAFGSPPPFAAVAASPADRVFTHFRAANLCVDLVVQALALGEVLGSADSFFLSDPHGCAAGNGTRGERRPLAPIGPAIGMHFALAGREVSVSSYAVIGDDIWSWGVSQAAITAVKLAAGVIVLRIAVAVIRKVRCAAAAAAAFISLLRRRRHQLTTLVAV
jgi:hypothetical protein